ncbi:hypothetical protein [Sulfurimonas sp.]|uniref:hypothetical protein n=1 Tax=Sulfurimonas sp. TaxID=2022749 RepID=UPI0025F6EB38|nr:hypothetical protein [Sulfurimonas sp.]
MHISLSKLRRVGEKNIKKFPLLTSPKNVILFHHEYLDGSVYGRKGEDIPLMSQIISPILKSSAIF